jgi:hypothetical protein
VGQTCGVDVVGALTAATACLGALGVVLWRIGQLVEEFRGHSVMDAADHATANGLTWQDGYRAGVLHAEANPPEGKSQ